MNGADQTEGEGEEEKETRAREGGGGEIERSACGMDERMRESGTRNCTALEKIAFPLIISSRGADNAGAC